MHRLNKLSLTFRRGLGLFVHWVYQYLRYYKLKSHAFFINYPYWGCMELKYLKMKKTLNFVLFTLLTFNLISCNNGSEKKANNETAIELKQYPTVRAMLEDAGDYYEENGSLKFLSEEPNNTHIQVSKPISENDLENVIQDIVKRDIIYVAFQVFAQTNINEITITSIPKSLNQDKYFKQHSKTLKVNKSKAQQVLKKFLNTDDFSTLFTLENGIWLPNKKFDVLKHDKLDEVYVAISQ